MEFRRTEMRTLWRALTRTVLWDYDRGTVPYDFMVLAIVAFVFLSPRVWFNDRARITAGDYAAAVEVIADDRAIGSRTYRIDARLLMPAPLDAQSERRVHEFLGRNVESLRGRNFRIEKMSPHRREDGTVFYDVTVKQ